MAAYRLADLQNSLLAQIQQAEENAAQQIEAAQKAAEKTRAEARTAATQLKQAAEDEGRQAGEARHALLVEQARLEAEHLMADEQTRIEHLNSNFEHIVSLMARRAVEVVLGDGLAGDS